MPPVALGAEEGGCRVKLLEVQQLSRRFGGLVAVKDVDFDVIEGEILGDRPERRWQEHAVQADHLVPETLVRARRLPRRGDLGAAAAHRRAQGRGPDIPGNHDLSRDDRASERRGGAPSAHPGEQPRHLLQLASRACGRGELPGQRGGDPRLSGPRRGQGYPGARPAPRLSARARHSGRDGPSPRSCCSTSRSRA